MKEECLKTKITRVGCLLVFFSLLQFVANGSTYYIGSAHDYISPNALYLANVVNHGDTIIIESEVYSGQSALANWSKNDLHIYAVGDGPHMKAEGAYILGKGIWVLSGNNISIENIEFSEASVPDQNGAGIRLDGNGLTVRYCHFHDNENGILTNNSGLGTVTIEYSEFGSNGYGDGFSHNLYIGRVEKLIFQYNYSHHAKIGHNLKSRAQENIIRYNRIMDEETGNSSRLIDLPNGGFSLIQGNVFMQGPQAENGNAIGYGLEGLENQAPHELFFLNNTIINKRQASCIFLNIQNGTDYSLVANNIFGGIGTLFQGDITEEIANFVRENTEDIGLEDEPNYNYQIHEPSEAIDFGVPIDSIDGYSGMAFYQYVHPTSRDQRIIKFDIDAGAYEAQPSVSSPSIRKSSFSIYPNPALDFLELKRSEGSELFISIYNSLGVREIFRDSNMAEDRIDVSSLSSGVYYIILENLAQKKLESISFVKSVRL